MTKRLFDIIFSIIGISFILPVLFILYFFVVFGSKGGFIYKQLRVGKNNKEFYLFKIRTMFANADTKGLLTTSDKDRRITKVGLFLRKYKLDELPQLFNILINNMSFVGPRPEVKRYVDIYDEAQKKVLLVKPGLTDYASLLYYNENKIMSVFPDPEKVYIKVIMPRKLRINLIYLKKQSFCMDLSIILKTLLKWL